MLILSIIHCSPDKIVGEDQLFKKLHDQIDKRVSCWGAGAVGGSHTIPKRRGNDAQLYSRFASWNTPCVFRS